MYNSILDIPIKTAAEYPDRVSHRIKHSKTIVDKTYKELLHTIGALTAGFAHFGVSRKEHAGFFMDNRFEWITTDFALMALGAVSVPRGSTTAPREVQFIFHHSDSCFLILETCTQLVELNDVFTGEDWDNCRNIFIVEDGEGIPEEIRGKVHFYSELIKIGTPVYEQDPDLLNRLSAAIKPEDLLTIVYTSGTTGNPKGVMLSHANFLQNVHANTPRLELDPERPESCVVMLPSWHVYERAFEYCAATSAMKIVYSSAKQFPVDLLEEKPEILITVPRVWESIYQKMIKAFSKLPPLKRHILFFFINLNTGYMESDQYLRGSYISLKKRSPLRKGAAFILHSLRRVLFFPGHKMAEKLFVTFKEKVGGKLRAATSAAGTLPRYLDELFNTLGITLVNAYGMTETAPGILSRTIGNNTFGTTGIPFDNTEVEIRREDGTVTDIGEKGVIFARGPQVMSGYYKNPEATEKVLAPDGWLNTGDLGVKTENGEIIIVGRMKDTIVLMGGENVEPETIEEKMKESIYIDHAVVLGQDKKQLSAIVAVNEEELMKLAAELKLKSNEVVLEGIDSINHEDIIHHLMKEVNGLISREHGFKTFEFISKIFPVRNDFSVGKELTQTLKIKRKYIEERYNNLVQHLQEDIKKRRKK
ncbi:MAG: AMP-binding protein [Spirochaetales bacterium]|nr:AMP-binding protein [Spirochaetales bacterium]